MNIKDAIKEEAFKLGFSAVGIAPADYDPVGHDSLLQWVNSGHHAGMDYMERASRRRYDPGLHVTGARSVIVCALNYYTEPKNDSRKGYVSIYARGENYHRVIKDKLDNLCGRIQKLAGDFRAKTFVDSSPVGEKALAVKAGIGFVGKNGLIIIPKDKKDPGKPPGGNFHFLGGIITDLNLETDSPGTGTCGKCMKCIDACPTNAIVGNGIVDASRCISYHNTQNKEVIPDDIAEKIENMIFGCDICQLVCPYNKKSAITAEQRLMPRRDLIDVELEALKDLSEEEFSVRFKGNSIEDIDYTMFKRNVAIALSNIKKSVN
jgi:epoxyqueuosine reductase